MTAMWCDAGQGLRGWFYEDETFNFRIIDDIVIILDEMKGWRWRGRWSGSRLPNHFIHKDWEWNMKLERKLFDISQTQTNTWPAFTIDKGVIWFHSLLQDASKWCWMTELVRCLRLWFSFWLISKPFKPRVKSTTMRYGILHQQGFSLNYKLYCLATQPRALCAAGDELNSVHHSNVRSGSAFITYRNQWVYGGLPEGLVLP